MCFHRALVQSTAACGSGRWSIDYEDGDHEQLNWKELEAALVPEPAPAMPVQTETEELREHPGTVPAGGMSCCSCCVRHNHP